MCGGSGRVMPCLHFHRLFANRLPTQMKSICAKVTVPLRISLDQIK